MKLILLCFSDHARDHPAGTRPIHPDNPAIPAAS
jgi:hypothetical protein